MCFWFVCLKRACGFNEKTEFKIPGNMLCPTFLGWLDTLFWDEKWTHVCGNGCLPLSLHTNNQRGGLQHLHRRFIWKSELYWNCPQRAVPASQQHAWVCQKKETHQTGTISRHIPIVRRKSIQINYLQPSTYMCSIFVCSLKSSLCRHLRLTLGHHSAGNTGVHAL